VLTAAFLLTAAHGVKRIKEGNKLTAVPGISYKNRVRLAFFLSP
jgi:hypothetical protein